MKTDTATLVSRGLELHARIQSDQAELKKISAALESIALANPAEHEKLADEDREGTRWMAAGRLPVVFESDLIVGSVQEGAPAQLAMNSALEGTGVHLSAFYRKKTVWELLPKSGKAFRALAAELLAGHAPLFISACKSRDKNGLPKSRTVIAWDEAKPEPQA